MTEENKKEIAKILNKAQPTLKPWIFLLQLTRGELDLLWAMYQEWKERK